MKAVKKSMLIGAGVVTIGLAGLSGASLVSAATNNTSTTGGSSLVDKISSKFGLDRAKVQAVFDEDHAAHMKEMQAKRAESLKQAVASGKLTQAQADHITAAWKEIDALRGTTSPEDESDTDRTKIKAKMDALHTWATEQNINLREFGGFGGRGHGEPSGIRGGHRLGTTSTSESNTN